MHPISTALLAAGASVALVASVDASFPIDFEYTVPLTVEQTNPSATIPAGVPMPSGEAFIQISTNNPSAGQHELIWNVSWENLTGPVVNPGIHIHGPAALGSNAGVIVDIVGDTGSGVDPNGGTVAAPLPATSSVFGGATINDDLLAIITGGQAYVNLHTELNPSGEIRGQIVVPEPASLGLLGAAGTLLIRRRR